MTDWLADTRTSYDTVASSYAGIVRDAVTTQPYLRAALALFAEQAGGPVVDVGCGPGHFTAHLASLGLDVSGVDLSPSMIELAREAYPGIRFEVGSMTDLPLADASVAGVLAFWSLIHIPDDEVPGVLGHFHRVLQPGGRVVIGYHVGTESRLKTQGYGGHPMKVHVHRRRPEQVAALARDAGFEIEAEWLMSPDDDVPQAILFARRPPLR
ncbi:class I SAM-dependent methyltransferase [Amycolatopsis sp. NPDC049252]|uniref:class I SAM-dependent methyltransferase n=1 Tax=Amycolatopsis sp. NPDC049252 TaxID=3363933 RepID=UPI0037181E42